MAKKTLSQDKLAEVLSYPRVRRARAVEFRDALRTAQWEAMRAYADWCAAPPATREDAYVAYLAAADREDAATAVWRACCRASFRRTQPPAGRLRTRGRD